MIRASVPGHLLSLRQAGLIAEPQPVACLDDEPSFPSYIVYAAGADPSEEQSGNIGEPLSGFGIAHEAAVAQIKAAGECLESICSYRYRPAADDRHALPSASRDRLAASARFRDAFCAAFPAFEQDRHDLFDAVKQWPIRNPLTLETSACPAQLISLSPDYASEPQLLPERTSAGLAAGVAGTHGALAGALLELIERDAVAAAFADPLHIRPYRKLPDAIARLVTYVEGKRLKLLVFDIASDLTVPTALCLALDETGRGPFLSAGSASAFSVEAAMEKAILESVQSRSVLRGFAQDILATDITDRRSIADGLGRVAYWWDMSRRIELDDYLSRASDRPADGAGAAPIPSCEALLDMLAARNFDVWVADITLPPVRAAGFEVVRALVPGLHRLPYSEENREDYSQHYGHFVRDGDPPPHPIA